MEAYKQLWRIPGTEKKTNKEVLQKSGLEKMVLIEDVHRRGKKYLAHKIREEGLLTLQGTIKGKPP